MSRQSVFMRQAKRMACGGALGAFASIALAANQIPKTMQAIVQTGTGGPEVLKLECLPVPQPGENQC